MNDETAAAPVAQPDPAPVVAATANQAPLANSVWCTDKAEKLGMIAEINSGIALFYYERAEGGLDPYPARISIDELKRVPAAMVPARLSFTAEQLKEQGYQ